MILKNGFDNKTIIKIIKLNQSNQRIIMETILINLEKLKTYTVDETATSMNVKTNNSHLEKMLIKRIIVVEEQNLKISLDLLKGLNK